VTSVNGTKRPLAAASVALLAVVVLGIVASAGPATAVDVACPEFEAFAENLHDLVPDDQRGTLAEATDLDGAGDQYHPSGEEPGITPPEADIALGATFEVEMAAAVSSAEAGPGGILNCASGGTVCSTQRAGEPPGRSFHAYAGTMRAPLVPSTGKRTEFGVAAFDETPHDGRPAAAWEAIPEFSGDFFQGSNVAWTLLSENGEPYRLLRLEYGPGDAGFLAAKTDAIAIVRESAWLILIPKSEWDGTISGRLYVFRADGRDFAPATSVVDTYPDIFEPAQPSAGRPTIALLSTRSRGLSTGWLVALGGGVLLVLALGGWLVLRRRPAR
jgi:hypothetical protein